MFQIIEQFIMGKKGSLTACEDGLFLGEHYLAVIDGVTSKSERLWNGKTSGFYAKETILDTLAGLPGNLTATEAISSLNNALFQQYDFSVTDYRSCLRDRLGATIALYSIHARQIWVFGDCQCRINGTLFTHETEMERIAADARSVFDHAELLQGRSIRELQETDPGRDFLMPFLLQMQYFSNQGGIYGYDVLNGFPIHTDRIRIYAVSSGDEVVLASDGYPELKGSLAESEAVLKLLKASDPLCIDQFKSIKRFQPGNCGYDDRTYLRFTVD